MHADMSVYVDDGFCTTDENNQGFVDDMERLAKDVKIEVQPTCDFFCGMNITQLSRTRLDISSKAYLMAMVKKYLVSTMCEYTTTHCRLTKYVAVCVSRRRGDVSY